MKFYRRFSMSTPLEELGRLSQYLSDISEDDLVTNFEQMAVKGGRKMTFSIKGPSVKALTIRFTPEFLKEWHPEAKNIKTADVRQRANTDLSLAFKHGNAVLEVVNADNSRTAYVSEKTKKMLDDKTLTLKKSNGDETAYTEIKVLTEESFETMLHTLIQHITDPSDTTPQLSKEQLTESAENVPLQPAQQNNPPMAAAKTAAKQKVPPLSVKSKKPKEVEERELEKQEEKELEHERDLEHEKRSQAKLDERTEKTIKAQEIRSEDQKAS